MLLDNYKLEQTLCTICHKYLSVFPIKIYGDNKVITCGRCSEKNDEGEKSLYEIVAGKFLFKCINRYEGCKKLLKPEDVNNHEQKCIGSYFVCPKCKDCFAKSVLELIWHFKTHHCENFLKKKFNFKVSKHKDTFLYINGEVIFIICYQYQAQGKTLSISAISLTTNVNATQNFMIFVSGTVQKFTNVKPCKTLNNFKDFCYKINLNEISANLVTVLFELKITDISANAIDHSKFVVVTRDTKFLTQDGQVINSVCYNCNELIGNDIYRCVLKLHPVCKDCNIWCGFCKCTVTNQKVLISNLEKTLLFPCNYCGKAFSDIKNHQMNCDNNIKTCPVCFMNIKVSLLESHFKLHQTVCLFQFSLDKYSFNNLKNEIYFLLNEKFILLKWKRNLVPHYSYSFSYDFNVKIQDDIDNAKLLLICDSKVLENNSVTGVYDVTKYKLYLQFFK